MSKTEKKTKKTPEEKAARKAAKEAKKAKKVEVEAQPEVDTAAAAIELTKKEKKDKKRKRDHEDDVEPSKESKKSKQSKRAKAIEETAEAETLAPAVTQEAPQAKSTAEDFISLDTAPEEAKDAYGFTKQEGKKSKKDKKSKRTKTTDAEDPKGEAVTEEAAAPDESNAGATGDASSEKNNRFIVFVGNLPYSATKEDLQAHFEKLAPKDIRIMTDKNTKKPKGFAFIEFDRFDRMQTCLKKYNHSVFPDGKKGRKINVELTAGGGGNNESRIFKIQAKNEKLANERERDREKREELEAKQDERKKKKEQTQKKADKKANEETEKNGSDEAQAEGIHPARLAMMQKPARFEPQQHSQRKSFRY